jgi:hypothetical protein
MSDLVSHRDGFRLAEWRCYHDWDHAWRLVGSETYGDTVTYAYWVCGRCDEDRSYNA